MLNREDVPSANRDGKKHPEPEIKEIFTSEMIRVRKSQTNQV